MGLHVASYSKTSQFHTEKKPQHESTAMLSLLEDNKLKKNNLSTNHTDKNITINVYS